MPHPGFGRRAEPAPRRPRARACPSIAIYSIALTRLQTSGRAGFHACGATPPPRCAKLGIVVAQPACCPQAHAFCGFCPRSQDSGNRVRPTGLWSTQVLAQAGEMAVVHNQAPPLLLRLWFYKDIQEEVRDNFPRRRWAAGPGERLRWQGASVPARGCGGTEPGSKQCGRTLAGGLRLGRRPKTPGKAGKAPGKPWRRGPWPGGCQRAS